MSVAFDGSTYITFNPFTITDGKAGTFSAWVNFSTTGTLMYLVKTANGRFSVARNASNKIVVTGKTSADVTVLTLTSATSYTSGWYHILASWDLENSLGNLYINGADDLVSFTLTDATIDYSDGAWVIGTDLTADVMELWFYNGYIDITDDDTLEKFYGDLNEKISLGPYGSRPIDGVTRPPLFLNKGPANFNENIGSGEDGTTTGTLTIANDRAPQVETLSRGFRGEKWRISDRSGRPFRESQLVPEPATGLQYVHRTKEYSEDRDYTSRRRYRGRRHRVRE